MAKRRKVKCELAAVFGPEPTFDAKVTKKNYNAVLIPALQWYGQYGGAPNSNSLRTFHKAWLKEWALANGFKKGSFTIPNQGVGTYGSLARCALRGFKLAKRDVEKLKTALREWVPVKPKKVDRAKIARMLSIKAAVKNEEALKPFLTKFDTAIDEVMAGAKKWDIETTGELNNVQRKELTAAYKSTLAEFNSILTDPNLAEGYRKLPKLAVRRLVKLLKEILEEIAVAGSRGTVMRKAKSIRRKKAKPASALISKLKYLPVHNDYNLVSVDPEKLVGATTVYLFESKKRLLKRIDTMGMSGIEVGGSTLKNVKCTQKKIRKPDEQLKGFGNMSLTKAAKLFDSVRALEKECTGRVNASTIILRVFP